MVLFEHMSFIWLLVAVAMFCFEGVTLGLTTIWFAVGALFAAFISIVSGPVWLQIAVFVLVSILCIIFVRNWAVDKFNHKREKTNADSLIGQRAVVTENIYNLDAVGKVEINGMEWSARQAPGVDDRDGLSVGTIVVIEDIQGVKLIVRREVIH